MEQFQWMECEHQEIEIRQREVTGGAKHWVKQCLRCGSARGNVKNEFVALETKVKKPLFDEDLGRAWTEERQKAFETWNERKNAGWWAQYEAYLLTPEWRAKRQQVLERAEYQCEGCRRARATQVHHLTYRNLGNELLFQLVAVCDLCHEIAHGTAETVDERAEERWPGN